MNRRTLIIAALVITGALVTAVARKSTAPPGWPENNDATTIKFSHKFHLTEAGVACTDCHPTGKSSTNAADNLRSTHDNCVSCHEEQINNTCAYCHKDPDNIQAAPAPERTLLFSHAQHAAMKDVECATCHAGLDTVEYAGPANMPGMATCTTCHNNVTATNACESCHTSFTNLIPANHLAADFKKEHRQMTRLGELEVSCATCHSQNFCAECHGATPLVQLGQSALMADPSPRVAPGSDSPRAMELQMVHSMNYRFTHGIDAKAKSADCYTCHSSRDFCAKCHAEGDNLAPGERPAWHLGAGFATLGVGSGGGRHAEFARRDIESCMSCHDVRGGDPVCITCHTDADGIRGTDPRTHPGGFMKEEEEGAWHHDAGASCYTCHTDMNASPNGTPGRGFCGYCHGSK
ncbi:MAG: cytochrome c3 family protein [Bacteroidota bacterium]